MSTFLAAAGAEAASVPAPWLRRVPVPVFAIGMGITGVGLCSQVLHGLLGTPRVLADVAIGLGAVAGLAAAAAHAAKLLLHPDAARADWHDAAQSPLFAQSAVTLLLHAEATEGRMPMLASLLFAAGAAGAAALSVMLLARWWRAAGGLPQAAIGPALAVPGIALLVVPILAPRHATAELGWAFVGLALTYFVAVGPALLTRIGTGDPLPERAQPGMAILVAVPSVALLALDGLTAGRWAGEMSGLGTALMGASALLGLLAAAALPRLLRTVPFALTWWAYSMPPAALSLALLVYGQAMGGGLRLLPGALLTLAVALGTLLLVVRTAAALLGGRLLPR